MSLDFALASLRKLLGPPRLHTLSAFRRDSCHVRVILIAFRNPASGEGKLLWFYFFLATASHGLLDAMTDGGLGVVFFSPFDTARYFLPWRPILVSPIGVARFLSPRGLAVLRGEIFWIWLPAVFLAFCACLFRRFRTPQRNE